MQASIDIRKHILLKDIETRQNSTLLILQCLFEQHQAVREALESLWIDLLPLSSHEHDAVREILYVLYREHLASSMFWGSTAS